MSKFWSKIVHDLHPYVPGEQPKQADLVKLNTNENPYGPSPKVFKALQLALNDKLRLYPDPDSAVLKRSLADYYQLEPNQVFVGNGSDEVLAHVFHGLFQHAEPILFPEFTYSFYPVYCGLYQIDYNKVPLTSGFEIDVDAYQQANGGIIFPNPNAPTGCLLSLADIKKLLSFNTDSVVVIDEAYIDFGGESAVSLINEYPNLLVTQTFSKSRSLAGMRLGYAMGHADLIEALVRVKDSFNSYPIDSLALAAGVAALEDDAYFQETCEKVIEQRDYVSKELKELGFDVLPSAANFVFARHPDNDAAQLAQGLRESNVIVRYFDKPGIDQFLRISIGTKQENQQMLAALDTLV
jgi:histidinol-phosphate aminotransferase